MRQPTLLTYQIGKKTVSQTLELWTPPCKGSLGLDHDTIASQSRNQLDHELALSCGFRYDKDQAFEPSSPILVPQVLSELALPFTHDELAGYAERRRYGLSEYSVDWITAQKKRSGTALMV